MNTLQSSYAKNKYLYPAEDDFILPKQVLTAVLKEFAWNFEPNDKAGRKTADDLKTFVKLPH